MMVGKSTSLVLTLLSFLRTTALAREITGPARTSCDASYSASCSRVNSEWLASDSAKRLAQKLVLTPSVAFPEITEGMYNMETGFYPFVFDRLTGNCVAHGANPELVGKSLAEIFEDMGIGFSLAEKLHERFVAAADNGGNWVQYMWREEPEADISNKVAFVTDVLDQYYLGVGYAHKQLPLELPCADTYDSWCSINNVRSLVGKAETRLNDALSLEQFEATLYDISFDRDEYFVEGGHYLFMYHYDGTLKAHAHLNRFTGQDLVHIFGELDRDPQEGADLHVTLRNAAEGAGDGWVQYPWKNKVDEPEYTKIAYVVKIVFQGEDYFLGCGYNFIMGNVVPGTYAMDLANRELQEETDEAVSCPGYNLPCSFGNVLQLTSHTLSHGLSSPMDLEGVFDGVTNDLQFKVEGWGYAYMYDFDGICVSHGAVPEFVGKTPSEILVEAGITKIDGDELHEKFRKAAELGGGYVEYDWTDPGTDGEIYQKVAYIFQLTREGRSFYGGVGLKHQRAPLQPELDTGTKQNGGTIPCSSQYGSRCSEINSQAILGQALGDLVLASSETKVRMSATSPTNSSIENVFASITSGSDLYQVNDFHISVFALDQSLCYASEEEQGMVRRDESGCCVAHGGNSSFVNMTWQEILDAQSITSIRGRDLHDRLVGQTDSGGHWIEYSWAQSAGGARTKIAFSSRFRDYDQSYYVMVEYFGDAPPATCNACPSNMECIEPNQFFCEPKVEEEKFYQTAYFIILILVVVAFPCLGICFCWIGKKREERHAKTQLKEIDQQMQTMSKQTEHLKKTAKQANKLVASLFPKQVHDRIMQQIEEEGEESTAEENEAEDLEQQTFTKDEWNSYMKGESTSKSSKTSSAPIADLFPAATISFADIVGFTAWSSTREPSQVFSLLESIYRRFDRVAKRLGVFKVETVGDCYVAVCGLPEKREDHPVVMARFATACLHTFKILVKELEWELGPGTGDLRLRTGLHSGPVTAGVLRGERGRFQLFGDTVNTAARMESTSHSDQVHLSQETVDLLLDAGKSHWVTIREDRVIAKGKGVLNTYWLQTSAGDLLESIRAGDTSTDAASTTCSGLGDEYVLKNQGTPRGTDDKTQGLVEWNVNIMKGALVKVVANRRVQKVKPTSQQHMLELEHEFLAGGTSLNEVKEIVSLPKYAQVSTHQLKDVDLDGKIVEQLREYIHNLAALYNRNPFHNFQHATHVTMSVVKLLSRIVAPEHVHQDDLFHPNIGADLHDCTYGITSDPLTQFSVLLSALIHDVDHPGVPNAQLVKEGDHLSTIYSRSVAELNSLDLAWGLLMDDKYRDLRGAIYSTEAEFVRFRQLMVNIVLATDIMDKDLGNLRKLRWNKAFANKNSDHGNISNSVDDNEDDLNRKATIVLEHLIQASDVAHTMQHWNVYIKWNERFFLECMVAYKGGRAEKDPSEDWYMGEIQFFDFYIIPLAKKLKECGVFGVSSAEYLRYAQQNRREWEVRGKDIVAGFLENLERQQKRNNRRLSG